MFNYYVGLALRSLRRNPVLTALMVVTIGVGIGASMTTLTVFRAMAADPMPHKSRQLFVPQIDGGARRASHGRRRSSSDKLEDQLSYIDAVALMHAHAAPHQMAAYSTSASPLTPANREMKPFKAEGRATFTDFFSMFEVPFQYGGPWSAAEDEAHTPVIVINQELNKKLFGGDNSVGRTISLDDHDYRIIGVMATWNPMPRFYDVTNDNFVKTADVFLPFNVAIERQMPSFGNTNCTNRTDGGWQGLLDSNCVWIQFWAELPTRKAAEDYRAWLNNYAAEQQRSGRFIHGRRAPSAAQPQGQYAPG